MSTQGRHAPRHHYGNGAAVLVIVSVFAAIVALALFASVNSHTSSPGAGAPGWHVTATLPPVSPATAAAKPRTEAPHATHLAHIAHLDHLARLHAEHLAHLAHLHHEENTT